MRQSSKFKHLSCFKLLKLTATWRRKTMFSITTTITIWCAFFVEKMIHTHALLVFRVFFSASRWIELFPRFGIFSTWKLQFFRTSNLIKEKSKAVTSNTNNGYCKIVLKTKVACTMYTNCEHSIGHLTPKVFLKKTFVFSIVPHMVINRFAFTYLYNSSNYASYSINSTFPK